MASSLCFRLGYVGLGVDAMRGHGATCIYDICTAQRHCGLAVSPKIDFLHVVTVV